MKLTASRTYLSTVINILQSSILPELQSVAARADAAHVMGSLNELLRRECDYPDALAAINIEGSVVIEALNLALGNGRKKPSLAVSSDDQGESLSPIKRFDHLTATMTELARALIHSDTAPQVRLKLLRRAAEWERGAHTTLQGLGGKSSATAAPNAIDPLSREAFERYIKTVHPDGDKVQLTAFERVSGGFGKQTWAVTITDAAAQNRQLIVRKCERTPLSVHKSFDLNREFDLVSAVNRAGFPAPKPLWIANHFDGADAPFYVMERSPGKPPGSYLAGAGVLSESFMLELAELLAKLHSMSLESLGDFIHRFDNPKVLTETLEQHHCRDIADWRDYAERNEQLTSPTLIYLFDWLRENIPKDDRRPVLIHGDFGIHNMLADNGHVAAILDWEAAAFGSPVYDLAYIKPTVEKNIEWQRFYQHYLACGGRQFDPGTLVYYQTYLAMKFLLPMNRAVMLFRTGQVTDIKFTIFELGFNPIFMSMGLDSTAPK